MSVWTCCWYCNSLAPRWCGRRRLGRGYCPWGPGREMATQKLDSGSGLEKWTWPGKWTLNASQIGCHMVWWGSAYIPVGWESIVQFRWLAKVTRNLCIDNCAKTWQGWNSPQRWKSTIGMRTAEMVSNSGLQALLFMAEPWFLQDTHTLLPALAGTSRAFRGWARRAASNYGLTVRRVSRLTPAVTLDFTQWPFWFSLAEKRPATKRCPRSCGPSLLGRDWVAPPVNGLRHGALWRTYHNNPRWVGWGWDVWVLCFVSRHHRVFWRLTATTVHENP